MSEVTCWSIWIAWMAPYHSFMTPPHYARKSCPPWILHKPWQTCCFFCCILLDEFVHNFTICSDDVGLLWWLGDHLDINDTCHEKTDLKVFVVVIPKEVWARVAAPIRFPNIDRIPGKYGTWLSSQVVKVCFLMMHLINASPKLWCHPNIMILTWNKGALQAYLSLSPFWNECSHFIMHMYSLEFIRLLPEGAF